MHAELERRFEPQAKTGPPVSVFVDELPAIILARPHVAEWVTQWAREAAKTGLRFVFLVGVLIAMLSEVFKFAALLLLSHPEHQTAFTTEQVRSLAALLLDVHRHSIAITHVFWGLWLLPMGYLVFRSGYIPRILGVLLIIGGVGYLIDVLLVMLVPNVDVTISQFTFVGEVLLPLWLVVKGVNVERWEQRVREPVAQHAAQRAERQLANA